MMKNEVFFSRKQFELTHFTEYWYIYILNEEVDQRGTDCSNELVCHYNNVKLYWFSNFCKLEMILDIFRLITLVG